MSADLIHGLASGAARKHCARGEPIWREGSPARAFHVIATGLVKVSRRAPDGHDAIVALFGPHESIGAPAVVAGEAYHTDAIAAADDTDVLVVAAAPVLDARRSDPAVAAALNAALLEHTRALEEKIRIMTAGAVPKRLAMLLLHLAERFGDEGEDGTTRVPVCLSRGELAHMVGTTVETSIRTMSRWRRSGLVDTLRAGFELRDVGRLEAIAAGERA